MTRLIALALGSTPAAVAAVRAVWDAGDALLPLDPAAPAAVTDAVLTTLRPDRIATVDDLAGRRLPTPLPTPAGTALVVATSGSTGTPKGVVLSAAALDASTTASLRRLGGRHGEVWRVALPLHHVAGLMALRRSWASGTAPDVVPPGDVPAIAAPGADHVALVPTQLRRWLDRAEPAEGAPRSVLLGGAAAPPDLLHAASAAALRVVRSYGMTETCGGCVYDGWPLDGVEVRVDDTGRIAIRGAVLFDGYRGQRVAPFDGDGWFTTGDLGGYDPDGRLHVLGRADDVIVSGGENVPLPAVIAALRDHPSVAEAAAVGVPDAEWGQVVRAVVVPADAAAPPTLAALRDHVREQHPTAFAPRELVVVAALPRDAMGKVTGAALARLPTAPTT